MRRWIVVSVLFGGTALFAQQSSPAVDISTPVGQAVTPQIALPGSGTPVNSGVVDVNANNLASGTGATVITEQNQQVTPQNALPSSDSAVVPAAGGASAQSQNHGVQQFESGITANDAAPAPSLAQIANYYKTQKQQQQWNH